MCDYDNGAVRFGGRGAVMRLFSFLHRLCCHDACFDLFDDFMAVFVAMRIDEEQDKLISDFFRECFE
jgi:hypothetical protein